MLAVEAVGGILTDSLAVLADAGHLFSDAGSIGLALFAASIASRSGGSRRTFGYQRSEVLAALANGLLLVAVAIAVAIAAVGRLGDPPAIDGGGVLALGLFGLAGNVVASVVLAGGGREDLNLEGALRHSLADALGSLGVVVAGACRPRRRLGDRRPDRRPGDRRPDPGLLLAPDQRAGRGADGGGPGGPRRRLGGRGDLRRAGRALRPRPPRLDRDPRLRRRCPRTSSSPPARDRDLILRRLEVLLHERFAIDHTTVQMEEEADQGLLEVERAPPEG